MDAAAAGGIKKVAADGTSRVVGALAGNACNGSEAFGNIDHVEI